MFSLGGSRVGDLNSGIILLWVMWQSSFGEVLVLEENKRKVGYNCNSDKDDNYDNDLNNSFGRVSR